MSPRFLPTGVALVLALGGCEGGAAGGAVEASRETLPNGATLVR